MCFQKVFSALLLLYYWPKGPRHWQATADYCREELGCQESNLLTRSEPGPHGPHTPAQTAGPQKEKTDANQPHRSGLQAYRECWKHSTSAEPITTVAIEEQTVGIEAGKSGQKRGYSRGANRDAGTASTPVPCSRSMV